MFPGLGMYKMLYGASEGHSPGCVEEALKEGKNTSGFFIGSLLPEYFSWNMMANIYISLISSK